MARPVFFWNQLPSVGVMVTVEVAERPRPMKTEATYHCQTSVKKDMAKTAATSTSVATVSMTGSLTLERRLPTTGMPTAMASIWTVTYSVRTERSQPIDSETG